MRKHYIDTFPRLILQICCCFLAVGTTSAQSAGITIGPGCTFTIGDGAIVSVIDGDVHVQDGATLVNQGDLNVGGDLIVEGLLQTTIGGSEDLPEHGRIHVVGDAEYGGSLAVALARGSSFKKKQDFILATYNEGFGTLTARQMPGNGWYSDHRTSELVVTLKERESTHQQEFSIEAEATLFDSRVVIDWITEFDLRSEKYVVERYNDEQGWISLGETQSLGSEVESAYYSTVDNNLPEELQILRYRISLEDAEGTWQYSNEMVLLVGNAPKLKVFPNPVTGDFVRLIGIDHQRDVAALRLISSHGQVLKSYAVTQEDIQVLELPSNINGANYFIELSYSDGLRQSCQLVLMR